MKNLLARGGIEFLAVLLGISGSLWIENNKQEAELELEREKVFSLIQKEVDQIILYTDNKINEYELQTYRIETLRDNWNTFRYDTIQNINAYYEDVWFTYVKGYDPDFTTYEALKSDGRINLLGIEIRKKLGKFYEEFTQWKRVELNENEMRNDLYRYISRFQADAYKKYPIGGSTGANFFKFLELTRNDNSIFSYFSQKSGFATGRNRRVKGYRDGLIEIADLINESIKK